MIHRGNWLLTKKYLKYREEVHQLAPSSVHLEERWLRHVLEWASSTSFSKAPNIRPVLPKYIVTARRDDSGKDLSPAYIQKIIGAGRRFFEWLSSRHERGHKTITAAWLDSLRAPRLDGQEQKFVAVTLDEMLEIAKAPAVNIEERRIKAASCFWFLSGIRIGAFVTLPISAIDLNEMSIKQWPELGVKTKFKKHATTFLVDIPELTTIVQAWDIEARSVLDYKGLWFAPFSVQTSLINSNLIEVGNHRHSRARKSLKAWLKKVGLPYHKPHNFRHGHAVYSIKHASNISDLKAISMNLMHNSLQITDGVYGIFSQADIQSRVTNLGKRENIQGEMIETLEKVIARLRN